MSQEPPGGRPPEPPYGGPPPHGPGPQPGPGPGQPYQPAPYQPAQPAGYGEGEEVLGNTHNNRFGTVTTRAVHYRLKKNLFAGTIEEDLVIRHINSVRVETSRHGIWGAILALIGGTMFLVGLSGSAGTAIFGLIILAIGAFLIWGWPKVVVNVGEAHASVSWPWTRTEAKHFRDVLNREVLSQQRG